jgi:hypothetical protein
MEREKCMNSAVPAEVPSEFRPVVLDLPAGMGEPDGYARGHRFIGFYWDPASGPMWDDGEPIVADRSAWWPFVAIVVRISEFYSVSLGNSGAEATHLLVWDRAREEAYIAPRPLAIDFIRSQSKARDSA